MKAALNQKPGERQDNVTANGGNICANSPVYLINFARKFSISGITPQLKQFFFLGWIFFFPELIFSQAISVTNVTTTPVCAGSDVTVTFDVTNGSAGNHYTNSTNYQVYLSDNSGLSFLATGATFSLAASYDGSNGGITTGLTHTFTIPAGTSTGSGYKIAIGSTNPVFDASAGAGASGVFTVNALVTPGVSITSDDADNTICAGTVITFTAAPTNGGITPLYQWRVNGLNVGSNTSNNTFTTSTLTNPSVVTVVLTSNEACLTGNPVISNPGVTVNVNPIPSAPTAGANTVCVGGDIDLTASTVPGATYSWTGPNSFTSSVQNPTIPNASAAMNGTYYVTATVAGCTSAAGTKNVTVNAIPATPTAGNDGPLCIGGTVNLTASNVAGATYSWTGPNGFTSSAQNPSLTNVTAAMAGNYNVIATVSGSGCSSNPGTTTVTVNPVPSTPAISTNSPVCAGSSIDLSTASVPGATYNWTGPSSFSSTAQNPTRSNATTAMGGNYSLTLTVAGSGCTSNAATSTVVVNAIPSTPVASNSGPLCVGSTLNLGASNVAGASYSWIGPGGFTSSLQNPTINNVTAAMAGSYSVTATMNGCTSPAGTTTVVVNSIPAAPATTANISVCAGSTINLTAGNIAGASYSWTGPGGFTSSAQNPSRAGATTAMSGTYNVTATVSGCTSPANTSTVVVNTIPTITSTTPGDVCVSGSATLQATASAGSLNWYTASTGGSSIGSGSPFSTPSISATTVFYVDATANGCTTGSRTAVVATVYSRPTITSTTSNSGCGSGSVTVTLKASASAGTVNWFTNTAGGGPVATGPTYDVTFGSASITFYVEAQVGSNCISAAPRSSVTARRYNSSPTTNNGNGPSAKVSGTTSICPPVAGLVYNIPSSMTTQFKDASTYYKWSIPPGFSITSGDSTSQITVSVGAGAPLGSNPITVTAINPCGNSGPSSGSFTVNVGNYAAVDAGPDLTICNGTDPTLTNTLSGAASTVTWTASTGTISGGPYGTAPFVYTPPAGFAGTATLTATTNTATGPCAASTGTDQVIVTVRQPSIAPSALNASSLTICSGTNITLTQTGGSLGTGATWKWYTNPGFTSVAGTSSNANAALSVSPTSTTTYYLRAESMTGAPCTAIVPSAASVTVTVNNPSVAPAALSASTATICSGSNTTLTQTGGSLGTGASWKWYSDAGYSTLVGTGSGSNASLVVNPTATTTYYLRIEGTASPCTAMLTGPSAGVTVTVNSTSTAPTSLSVSAATICNGDNIILTQNGGSLGTGAVWKWYTNSAYTTLVGTGAGANASLTLTPATSTTYYLRAESTTGAPCAANIAAPGNIPVTVNQPSVAPTGLSASTGTICKGGNTTLNQTGGSLGTGALWKWYTDNSFTTLAGTGTGATASLVVNPTATTTYYLRAESSTGAPCAANVAGPVAGVTVIVNDPSIAPTSLVTDATAICNPGSATLTQSGGSLGTGATWKWYSNSSYTTLAGTGSGANASLLVNPTSTTTYYLRAESTTGAPCAANAAGPGAGVQVIVNQPVTITAQPAVSQSVCATFPVDFAVTATGSGLTYQWYRNGNPVSNGGTVSGATTNHLHISQAALGDNGTYTVTVNGASPCGSLTSDPSDLTVNQAISITGQPVALTVCENEPSVAFTATATGTVSDYVWRKNGIPVSDGGKISGSTSATLTITTPAPGDAGNYDVVVTGPDNVCAQAVSSPAALTVNPTTVGGTVSSDQTICSGSSPSNLTLAGNVGNVLKWQKSSDAAFSSPVDIAGTSITLTGATIGSLTSTTYFRAVVQSGVCVAQNSSPVTVTVDPASVGGTASADQVLCSGSQPADISLSGNVGNVVKWQKSTNAAFSSPVDIPVAATTLTGATIGTLSATTYFRAVVKSGVCNPANSNTVSVTVNPIPDVVATPSASTICSQSNLTISLSGSVPNTLFTWVATTGNVTGATSANTTGSSFLNTLATSGPADGTVSYSITPSANGCTGTPVTVNITVKPLPTGTITAGVSGTVSVCVNDAQPQVTFTGGNGTAPYTFTYNINGAAPSYDITTSSGNSVPVNAPTTAAGTFNYNLVAVRDATTVGCSQTASGTAVVTIKPLPTVTSAVSATICSGTAQNYSITSGLGGTTYSWSRGTVAGISNAAVSNQTANPITETLVNTTGAAIIVPYTIIPSSNGCQGAPFTYNLTVNPVATLTLNSGAGSNNPSVCVTTPLTTSITYLVAGTTNTPTVTGLPAGLTSSYNSGTKIFTISGTPTASGSFGYTVSVVGVCGNGTAMGTITVNPAAVGGTTARTTGTPFVCSGSNSGVINLSGQTGNVLKWQSSINAGQTWTDISNTGTSQPFTNLTATTAYRAVLATSSCPSLVAYSTATTVSVVPATGPGSLAVVQLHPFICTGSDTLTALGLGGGSDVGALTGGEFDNAGSQLDGPGKWRKTLISNWNPQDKVNIEASTNNTDNSAFNLTNGPKTFLGTGGCAAVTMNNDPLGGQPNSTKFMATVGPNTSSLESPIFSLAGLTTASMDWWEYFALRAGASIKIELSIDGGSTYTTTLKTITGSTGDTTHGQPNNFTPATLNLDAYVGLNNLRIKFTYTGTACSLWGLEKATITKGSAPATYTWAQVIPTPSGGNPPDHHLNVFQNPTVIVTPPSPNTTDTPQIYTYSIASSAGGCLSNITVTVNPVLVTSATNGNGPLCSGSTMSAISLNANVTGTSFTWTRTNGDLTTGNVTGLAASGIGNTIPSATLVNTTTSPQTVTFTITPTNANACSPAPFTTSLTVNPNPSIVLSGSQNICGPGVQIVNVKSNGPFPINFTLSNGQAVTLVSKDSNIVLNPAITTPGNNSVSITAMSTSSCAAAPYSGTASIIVSPGATKPIGTWVGTAPCGGSGSDWFNPCNWGSGVIPTLSIDVTIDQTAQCNPVIDPTTSYALANGPIALARNITISGNSRNLSFSNGGELDIAGNWLNNTGVTGFTANTGTVAFVGSAAQSIKTVGSSETFYNLVINNTSAPAVGVTLLSNVNVTHTLTLTNGIVNTKSVPPSGSSNGLGLLTLKSTVTPIAGNPGVTSFINGQLAKEFTNSGISSEYIYPVGKIVNGTPTYKGMAVQPTTTSGTTTFTVEYFPTAHPVPTVILGVGLVGTVPEYWQVDRSGGTADARIKIPYQDPGSGNWLGNNNTTVPDPCSACNVAVVRKDASSNGWDFTKSAGNFNTSDPESRFYQDNGFIYSGSVSSFGPFTNGYAYFVILPVQLLTFESKLSNGDADLTWTIDNPEELAGFEVEYSRDGRNYSKLADIAGGATTEYGYTHTGISAGSNYYRLIVKDKKGTAFYSKTLLIVVNRDITVIKGMRPTMVQNNTVLDIYSAQTQTVRAILLDVSGRTLAQYKMNLVKGENSLVINAIMLVQGYYTLHIMTDDGVAANLRFMKE